MGCTVNSCPTSIITGGLGQPAKNSLIAGMSRLNFKLCTITPTPTVTPTVTPTATPIPLSPQSNHHGINRDSDGINRVDFRTQWYNGEEMFTSFQYDEKMDNIIFKINNEIEIKTYTFTIKKDNLEGFKV